jgi:hypothetical protein
VSSWFTRVRQVAHCGSCGRSARRMLGPAPTEAIMKTKASLKELTNAELTKVNGGADGGTSTSTSTSTSGDHIQHKHLAGVKYE